MTTKEYNKLVDDYGHRLYLMIFKNIRDSDESKNLVQDTFEALWVNREKVVVKTAKSYLFTMGYRKMIDFTRRDKRINKYIENLNIGVQPSMEKKLQAKALLDQAFSQVKDTFRQVIILRDQEGYSYEEISQITGQSPAQVRTNIFRGRTKLREIIEQLENYKAL